MRVSSCRRDLSLAGALLEGRRHQNQMECNVCSALDTGEGFQIILDSSYSLVVLQLLCSGEQP